MSSRLSAKGSGPKRDAVAQPMVISTSGVNLSDDVMFSAFCKRTRSWTLYLSVALVQASGHIMVTDACRGEPQQMSRSEHHHTALRCQRVELPALRAIVINDFQSSVPHPNGSTRIVTIEQQQLNNTRNCRVLFLPSLSKREIAGGPAFATGRRRRDKRRHPKVEAHFQHLPGGSGLAEKPCRVLGKHDLGDERHIRDRRCRRRKGRWPRVMSDHRRRRRSGVFFVFFAAFRGAGGPRGLPTLAKGSIGCSIHLGGRCSRGGLLVCEWFVKKDCIVEPRFCLRVFLAGNTGRTI